MLKWLKRHRNVVLSSIFFFYLGCGITLSFVRLECTDAASRTERMKESLNQIQYAVLVLTSPENETKRDAIRGTWALLLSNIVVEHGQLIYRWRDTQHGRPLQQDVVKIYFVVGTRGLNEALTANLNTENNKHQDLLLLEGLHDGYKNLTSKVLQALKWSGENLKSLKYLIKCDDDSFVRVDSIVRELVAYAPAMDAEEISTYVTYQPSVASHKGLYWGYFDGRARVQLRGKWQERGWFLCDNYLPYALGGAYVISRSIVHYIANNADLLSEYNAEDVSMGVWTAALDGINRVHDVRFDTQWKSRGCGARMLVRHKQTPGDMLHMYRTLTHSYGQQLCDADAIQTKFYHYKWDVLPSMCCR